MTQLQNTERKSLARTFAAKYNLEPEAMLSTLKSTCFRQKQGEVTNEQMAMLMVVANEYNLNPFTKEIYAFPDKGGIIPIVGVDGWIRIINDNPVLDGLEFKQSETMVTMQGGKPCPEWMEVIIYRKDREKPTVVREYLDEVYKTAKYPSPWQTHTKRFFRHKTLIQGARVAFGYSGIYDQDEANNIIEGTIVENGVNTNPVSIKDEISEADSAIEGVVVDNAPEEALASPSEDYKMLISSIQSAANKASLSACVSDLDAYDITDNEREALTELFKQRLEEIQE